MTKLLFVILALAAAVYAVDATVSGTWAFSMQTDHGAAQGEMKLQQQGSKLTGSFDIEGMGTVPFTGKIEGNIVTLEAVVHDGQLTLRLSGTLHDNRIAGTVDPINGSWTAARQ